MRKSLPIIAAVLTACGAVVTSADNAADASQGARRAKETRPAEDPMIREARELEAAIESGGMPGCFDPSLRGRERAVAERLGGTPCASASGASPPGAVSTRSATWIVGAWATSRPECQGTGGITFENGGTFFADGDAGTWTLSGATLTMVTRETYELGDETTRLPNPVTRRMQVRAEGPNRMTIDGAPMVRCP